MGKKSLGTIPASVQKVGMQMKIEVQARRITALEAENAELRKDLVEAKQDNAGLQKINAGLSDMIEGDMLELSDKLAAANEKNRKLVEALRPFDKGDPGDGECVLINLSPEELRAVARAIEEAG